MTERNKPVPQDCNPVEWPPLGMTVAETAKALRVSHRTVQDMLAAGEMPGRVVGNKWRISHAAIDAWLATGNAKSESVKNR